MLSRRELLQGTAAFAISAASANAFADAAPLPIVFVHGDSDQAACWQTVFWRFESNGYPRDRLFAISFTNPQARDDDGVAQENRSSTADQLAELTAFVAATISRTGSDKVVLVANSRGGFAVRNYISLGGDVHVAMAILCGTPNHGVFAFDAALGNEYNGRGAFLQRLNGGGGAEVAPDVPTVTLRSDGFDKYAQPDGRFLGHAGLATHVGADGPALKGATNVTLGELDHRETAYSPRAFAEIYRFIVGRAPARISIEDEAEPILNGRVTGMVGDVPTNRPVAGARVEIYAASTQTGERIGAPLTSMTTGADGVWGPLKAPGGVGLEFVVEAPGERITHIYRSPFPRSFAQLDLRPAPAPTAADAGAAAVVTMTRPRGYFGLPRDIVLLDGREPPDVTPGVPTDWRATLRLAALEDRPIVAQFNEERIVVRAWPSRDNHTTIAEFTY